MKKILFLLLVICLLGCVGYPEEPPYLVGEEAFTIQKIKKEAPYRHSNDSSVENDYALYNIPSRVATLMDGEKWAIIEQKYKADLFYIINKKENDVYMYRHITKSLGNSEQKLMPLTYLFKLLKAEGIAEEDCKVLKQKEWVEMNIRYVLLLYKGVKHQVTLGSSSISIESYPKAQQTYWENQGRFMMDTSQEVEQEWLKKK